MRQLVPQTLMDILAWSEVEGLPTSLSREFQAYAARVAQEVPDIPDGAAWDAFIAELGGLPPGQVPTCFRAVVAVESQSDDRGEAARNAALALLAAWADVEPVTVEVVNTEARITRAATPVPKSRRSSGPAKARASTTQTAKAQPEPEDPERDRWIKETCLDRVHGAREGGLAQMVLIAGVLHRAKEKYPGMHQREVLGALTHLAEVGTLQCAAGRWRLAKYW